MKEYVFIAWSGNKSLAIKIKNLLDKKGNICIVGGNYINNPIVTNRQGLESGAVNNTVCGQMACVNQAIILIQKNSKSGMISRNLCYELGFLSAKLESTKIHLFYMDFESTSDPSLPSDIQSSWGNLISTDGKSEKQLSEEISKIFVQNTSKFMEESKFMSINNYRHIEYALDTYLQRPLYSYYEMAKYIILYVQAAFIYQECESCSQKCDRLKSLVTNGIIKSNELEIVLEYARVTLMMFEYTNPSEKDGCTSLKGVTFRKILKEYKTLMSLLLQEVRNPNYNFSTVKIDSGEIRKKQDEFTDWLITQTQQHTAYLYMAYFNSVYGEKKENERKKLLLEAVEFSLSAIYNLKILEKDSINKVYVNLLLGYVYRNMSAFQKLLGNASQEFEYQEKSYILRRNLYEDAMHTKQWNAELKNYISLEYYLQVLENIKNIEDTSERADAMIEIREYIETTKKNLGAKMLMFYQLEESFTRIERDFTGE